MSLKLNAYLGFKCNGLNLFCSFSATQLKSRDMGVLNNLIVRSEFVIRSEPQKRRRWELNLTTLINSTLGIRKVFSSIQIWKTSR